MIRTYCDVCKKERKTEVHLLRTKNVEYGCDIEKVYMCEECSDKYDMLEKLLDVSFVNNRGNVEVVTK